MNSTTNRCCTEVPIYEPASTEGQEDQEEGYERETKPRVLPQKREEVSERCGILVCYERVDASVQGAIAAKVRGGLCLSGLPPPVALDPPEEPRGSRRTPRTTSKKLLAGREAS